MDQDRGRRPTPRGGRVFLSRDDTHSPGGPTLGSDGTAVSEWLPRRPWASSRVTGGEDHKLQGGAHHHLVPLARVIQAMAPTAHTGITNIRHDEEADTP